MLPEELCELLFPHALPTPFSVLVEAVVTLLDISVDAVPLLAMLEFLQLLLLLIRLDSGSTSESRWGWGQGSLGSKRSAGLGREPLAARMNKSCDAAEAPRK